MEMTSKEVIKYLLGFQEGDNITITADFINYVEDLKQDLEDYEQLKQVHDKTLVNNGKLVCEVVKLEKENQELKEALEHGRDNKISN